MASDASHTPTAHPVVHTDPTANTTVPTTNAAAPTINAPTPTTNTVVPTSTNAAQVPPSAPGPTIDTKQVTDAVTDAVRDALAGTDTKALCGLMATLVNGMVAIQTKASGDATAATALREFFHGQDQRRLHAYRATMEYAFAKLDDAGRLTEDDLRKKAIAMAKDSMLTEADVMLLTPLFMTQKEYHLLAAITLSTPSPAYRVALHNWMIARHHGENFQSQHGDVLMSLMQPLFPPDPGFEQSNNKLFCAATDLQGGGSARTSAGDTVKKMYATPKQKPDHGNPFASHTAHGGAPYVPVLNDGAGGYTVDLHDVATGFAGMRAQVNDLKRDLARVTRIANATAAACAPPVGDTGRGGRGGGRGAQGDRAKNRRGTFGGDEEADGPAAPPDAKPDFRPVQ